MLHKTPYPDVNRSFALSAAIALLLLLGSVQLVLLIGFYSDNISPSGINAHLTLFNISDFLTLQKLSSVSVLLLALLGVVSVSFTRLRRRFWPSPLDISARQKSLLKTGALQDAIFNSANFSCIATDTQGVIQIFNVGAERMLGYAARDVVDKITPADISDPQELITHANALSTELGQVITPGFESLIVKAARDIEDIYELSYIREDGSRFPAIVSVTALRDADEKIIGYLLIGTDNTARKLVEADQALLNQQLREQQFYTRSLIESNVDALITTNPSGIISDVNQEMESLTGCTRDELIGAPFKNYFTDAARAEAAINRALREGKLTNYELTVKTKEGKETVVSYNATTFNDSANQLLGVFASARDITHRKRF